MPHCLVGAQNGSWRVLIIRIKPIITLFVLMLVVFKQDINVHRYHSICKKVLFEGNEDIEGHLQYLLVLKCMNR